MFRKASAQRDLVDVRLLVSNVLALAHAELESHQIVLRNEIGEGLPEVMAARVQLQQVILNPIMNAIEAMTSVTGRERRLTIRSCLDQPATLTITVEDTGIGIDPAHFDRIFDPLFITKPTGLSSDNGNSTRVSRSYRRFATAAEAIRFAIEEFPAISTLGACASTAMTSGVNTRAPITRGAVACGNRGEICNRFRLR